MKSQLKLLFIVICAVIVDSEECGSNRPEYTRVKRSRYYSSSPQKFYRPPPSTHPVKGFYSHTPPPMYMVDHEAYPPSHKPKVSSRRPTSDSLGDEDINNFIKYLSKQDLDKIIEAASAGKFKEQAFEYGKLSAFKDVQSPPNINDQTFSMIGPFVSNGPQKPYEIEFNNPTNTKDVFTKVEYAQPQVNSIDLGSIPLNPEESMQSNQLSFLNSHLKDVPNGKFTYNGQEVYSDGKTMQEESLPRPVNLREDYDASFTNLVPSVVKAESSSYKVESFGELPLMSYNSKLDSVSSYHVPHYTVTTSAKTPSNQITPPASNTPVLEPAPPVSAAKSQSDSHLKAIKIWTHRSKGMAYYLHDDGTLSLEKPQRSKTSYHP